MLCCWIFFEVNQMQNTTKRVKETFVKNYEQ